MGKDIHHERRKAVSDFVDRQQGRAFQWGVTDCLMVVAAAIEAVTGIDHGEPYRGRYGSLAEGKALVGGDLLAFVADLLPEIAVVEARDGDVGALMQAGEWGFGVFSRGYLYVQTQTGLGILPKSAALKAFKVE